MAMLEEQKSDYCRLLETVLDEERSMSMSILALCDDLTELLRLNADVPTDVIESAQLLTRECRDTLCLVQEMVPR